MDPQVFAGSFFAQTTVVRRSRFCLLLVIPIIAKQVKHADLPAVAPAVPPSLESAPIKIIPKEDPATSATLFSKLVDPELAFLWSESGVQLGHQHTLAVQGYVTVRNSRL